MGSISSHTPLVVIVGETASGKSALAMKLAKQFNGEIVAADSWTVYREFNIGTAKPSLADRQAVPHHLIDVVNAPDGFNAALYKDLANAAIADIGARGKLPILVGGTGLYVDSVLFDFGFLPAAPAAERDRRNQQALDELLAEAKERKINLDGIDTRNKRRVIRALETGGQRPINSQIRPETLVIGMQPSKENLQQRIIQRVDAMVAHGLEQEVQTLAQKYGWDTEPMKGIGYREWQEYFEGQQTRDQTKEKIVSSTMGLAKRQRTWFKRNKSIQWVSNFNSAKRLVQNFLSKQAQYSK